MNLSTWLKSKNGLFRDIGGHTPNINSATRLGALVGLAILMIVFSSLSPTFREMDNLIYMAKNAAITISLVALGQTIVMIAGGIDLSVSSVVALSGLISALLLTTGIGPIPPLTGNLSYLGIAISWLIGALIGALQGLLITKWQIPAFIVTLATMLGLQGVTIGISGAIIYGLPTEFSWMSEGQIGIIPAPLIGMLLIYIMAAYWLRKSKVGRYCYAIGGNETAARLAGINVDRYRIYFYALSGLLSAITGTLLISHLKVAVYSNGDGYEFSSVAAAIIGGTSLTGGVGDIWGTLIGVAILAIIPSGLIMLNAPSWSRDVVTAIIIILAVIIDGQRTRARKKVIQVEARQSIVSSHYIKDILDSLAHGIEKYIGSVYCRVYLIDRDSKDLVPHDILAIHDDTTASVPMGKSQITAETHQTGKAVLLQDLTRSGYQRVKMMGSNIHSALAFPMFEQDRCIGIIELQSPDGISLKEESINTLKDLTQPIVTSLEDAWLFESGWLIRQIRDALRHLWDDLYLGKLDLVNWALTGSYHPRERTTGERGEALRSVLIRTINSLKPQETNQPHEERGFRILQLTYVEELPVEQIISTLHISRRQYFYDLKDSIEVLTDLMVRTHH